MNWLNLLNINELGNACKHFENEMSFDKMMPLLPVIVRFDGNNFSGLTKSLKRPYDERFSKLMQESTEFIYKKSSAAAAFTQSDEITLILHSDSYDISRPEIVNIFGNGRKQKIVSELTSYLTGFFNEKLKEYIPEITKQATFDCRVYQVPNYEWAINQIYWRQLDGIRNSKLTLGRCHYSQQELDKLSPSDIKHKLYMEKGVSWNDLDEFYKYGTLFVLKSVERPFTTEELEALPPLHNARKFPQLVYERNITEKHSIHLGRIDNIESYIFTEFDEMKLSDFKSPQTV